MAYEGTELIDKRTLLSYNIPNNSELIEYQEENPNKIFPYNSLANPEQRQFQPAPQWRRATRGLNLMGRCMQVSCKAYKDSVCIPKGMGNMFQIGKEAYISVCPVATDGHKAVDVRNMVFRDCKYEIEGFRISPKQEEFKMSGTTPKVGYLTFKETKYDDTWSYMNVKTSEPS